MGGLGCIGLFLPFTHCSYMACHPRGLEEGLAVEERTWEMLSVFPLPFPSYLFFRKDGIREEPISVLGGEIGSSKVRDGDCASSSFFTRPQRGNRALG